MKRIMIILGWVMVASMIAGGLIFVKNYRVAEDGFTTLRGTISGELKTTKDEYGNNTSLRIHLKNQKGVYVLPGSLLAKADQSIYELKDGDEVTVIIPKADNRDFMAKTLDHNSIWGLEKVKDSTYLTLEQAISHHRSLRTLVFAGVFFAMAAGLGVYLTRL